MEKPLIMKPASKSNLRLDLTQMTDQAIATKARHNTIWIREYPNGDWELGILKFFLFDQIIESDRSTYLLTLDLSEWQYVGDL